MSASALTCAWFAPSLPRPHDDGPLAVSGGGRYNQPQPEARMASQANPATAVVLAVTAACLVLMACGKVEDAARAPASSLVLRDPSGPGLSDGLAWREGDRVAPTVRIAALTEVGPTGLVGLSGTATDDRQLQGVRWSNNRGGSGLAMLTGSTQSAKWWVAGVQLQTGDNTITVTALDAAGNKAQAATVVARTPEFGVHASVLVPPSD